jgi:hypothetical protein
MTRATSLRNCASVRQIEVWLTLSLQLLVVGNAVVSA